MSENPLISVILLCYNQALFVTSALDGVLSQSYSPLEVVVIDDASPDNTAEVIEAHLVAHPRKKDVRFIQNPTNLGGRLSLKIGLEAAQGRFILLSCGDDVMLPGMIAEMAKVWRSEDVSLVAANAIYINEDSKSLNRTFRDPNVPADDTFETLARDGSNACCFGAALGFERELYETFGCPPDYLSAMDIMLPFYAYLLKGAKFISKPLIKYRVHPGNTSLSLGAERTDADQQMAVHERIYLGHLAHAVFMEEEINRLRAQEPERYGPVAEWVLPLLQIQLAEMSKKLVRLRRPYWENESSHQEEGRDARGRRARGGRRHKSPK